MHESCPHSFDQSLLSGFLDGELRQYDEQKVRNHLEDCEICRSELEHMSELREVAISTRFHLPGDNQWSEAPRGPLSRGFLSLGWILVVAWAVVFGGFTLWQIWHSSANLLEKLLIFGGISGFALLFLSVLLDRLATARTDPYREVEK